MWPPTDVGYGFGPPTENHYIKTLKRSMTKKRSSEILGDRRKYFWEMLKFCRETPKNGRSKIYAKIWPPVCEVLDPLVGIGYFATPAWWDYTSANDRARIDRLFNRFRRRGYLPVDRPVLRNYPIKLTRGFSKMTSTLCLGSSTARGVHPY